MSDKIIVLEDGVLKYYSGNNPAITEDPWASSRISCIQNDQLIRDVENIDITISAEISEIVHPHSLNQFLPTSISVDKDNPTYKSIDGDLYTKDGKTLLVLAAGKRKSTLVIPDGVSSISEGSVFANDECGFDCIRLPKTVTHISEHCLDLTTCSCITVDENNSEYMSIDGNLYTKDGKTLIKYATSKKESDFVLPDGVVNVADRAFYETKHLKNVFLPSSLETIGNSAFECCDELENIILPIGLTTIKRKAFGCCSKLKSIVVPRSVTNIGYGAFSDSVQKIDWLCEISKSDMQDCFEGNSNYILKRHTLESIYAPNVKIANIPSALKEFAVIGFVTKYAAGETDKAMNKNYLTYITKQYDKLISKHEDCLSLQQFAKDNNII